MSLVFWNSVVMCLRIIPFTALWLPFNMKTCASLQLWEIFICDNSIPPLSSLFLGLWPVEYRTYWMLTSCVFSLLLSYNLFGLYSGKFPLLLIASCFYCLFWQSYFLFKRALLCSFSFPKQTLLILWIQYVPWLSQDTADYKFKDYVSSISWVSSVLEETFFLFFYFFSVFNLFFVFVFHASGFLHVYSDPSLFIC